MNRVRQWEHETNRNSDLRIHLLLEHEAGERMKTKRPHLLTLEAFRDLELNTTRTLAAISRFKVDSSQVEFGFFSVNWSWRDRQIIDAFSEWLEQRRQMCTNREVQGAQRQPSNRGGLKDQLHWLGAFRVKKYYPHKQLFSSDNPDMVIPDAPYCYRRDLYENAKKGESLIKAYCSIEP